MPTKNPKTTAHADTQLQQIAQQLRAQRKALGVNATTAAEAANMSRPTVHRIEKGEPSVTLGAYLNLAAALGLQLTVHNPNATAATELPDQLPEQIDLAPYPQLQQLAWHVKAGEALTPLELWQIIQRNQKHVDANQLTDDEQTLLAALAAQFENHV